MVLGGTSFIFHTHLMFPRFGFNPLFCLLTVVSDTFCPFLQCLVLVSYTNDTLLMVLVFDSVNIAVVFWH